MKFAEKEWDIFWAVSQRVVPQLAEAEVHDKQNFHNIIDQAMGQRPPEVVGQLGKFLGLLNLAPILRYGRAFKSLPPNKQDKVLGWFQDAPISLFRRGTWGVKTFIFMGFYSQTSTATHISYQATFNGNEALALFNKREGGE